MPFRGSSSSVRTEAWSRKEDGKAGPSRKHLDAEPSQGVWKERLCVVAAIPALGKTLSTEAGHIAFSIS